MLDYIGFYVSASQAGLFHLPMQVMRDMARGWKPGR